MYRILYDGSAIYDPREENAIVVSASCSLKTNQSGELKFKIGKSNPMYGKMRAMSSAHEVVLMDDSDEVFRGRITDDGQDMQTRTEFTCQGHLAYFNDTIVRNYGTYSPTDGSTWQIVDSSASSLFEWYVSQHNAQVDSTKRFTIGKNELAGSLTRSSTQRPKTCDEINDKILKPLGCYIEARMENGVRIVDLMANGRTDSIQSIEFGVNLLDFATVRKSSGVVTEIIATGKTEDGKEFGLELVTDGTYENCYKHGDAIQSCEGVALYGVIQASRSYDETTPDGLLKAVIADLSGSYQVAETMTITAANLHAIDPSMPSIRLNQWVPIISKPLGINQKMMCTEISIDILDASKTKYTLGDTVASLTHSNVLKTAKARLQVEQVIQDAAGISAEAKAAAETANAAVTSTYDEYSVSTSSSTAPEDGWGRETPSWTEGSYIWRRVVSIYGDGSTVKGEPALMTGNTGESATLLTITSTHGLVFKDNAISTQLNVVITKGAKRIADITGLYAEYGSGSYIEWYWQRVSDSSFGVISASDSRISNGGFTFTVSPEDVDARTSFMAKLIV